MRRRRGVAANLFEYMSGRGDDSAHNQSKALEQPLALLLLGMCIFPPAGCEGRGIRLSVPLLTSRTPCCTLRYGRTSRP